MPSKFELLITLGTATHNLRHERWNSRPPRHLTPERPLALPKVALAPVQRPASLLTSSSGEI
jgi:hypothetical protein